MLRVFLAILAFFVVALGAAVAQEATPSTPATGAVARETPISATDSQVQRTVVEDHDNSGKWGLAGLLGLLGLAGLRRREGEVTVVDRSTPRQPVHPTPPGSNRT